MNEHDVRELLQRKADEVRIDAAVPPRMLTRARRRRVLTASASALTAIVVIVGGVAGARLLAGGPNEGPGPIDSPSAPAPGAWRGLWPQDTRAEAEAAQAAFDSGDRTFGWQADPLRVARRYGSAIKLWDATHLIGAPEGPNEIHVIHISNCLEPVPESQGGACEDAEITLEQLLEKGPGGLWFVTDELPFPAGPSPTPSTSPTSVPTPVQDLVNAFLAARVAGSGAEDPFLTQDSQGMYATHTGGLYLYDGDVSGGMPQTNFTDAFIDGLSARGDGTFDVTVVIETGEFEGITQAFVEQLWIGQGLRLDGSRGFVVRSAQMVTGDAGANVKDCVEGSPTPVRDCARAFMQTRMDGAGAEFYMTEDARGMYDQPGDALHLYGEPYEDSGGLRFQSYLVEAIGQLPDGTYQVDVELDVCEAGTQNCDTLYETLVIGPGRNGNSELQDFVVRSARLTPA